MNPQLLALIIQLVELAIQEEPAIALELHDIFSNPNLALPRLCGQEMCDCVS